MAANMLGKTGAPVKARAMMYEALVQAVLLYGSEIWVYFITGFLDGLW